MSIYIKLNGGLGNQLFQYALGRNLALKNNAELKLDISWYKKEKKTIHREYELKHFNIEENFVTEKDINKIKRFSKIPFLSRIRKEKNRNFESSILSLKKTTYLEGYWQSEKYFKENKETL